METITVEEKKEELKIKSTQEKQAALAAEIQKEREEKILKFAEAYGLLCKEHGCGMVPQVTLTAGQQPVYRIVPVIATK